MSAPFTLYPESCYGLSPLPDQSIDALVTDPPYGIGYQAHAWNKALPNAREPQFGPEHWQPAPTAG